MRETPYLTIYPPYQLCAVRIEDDGGGGLVVEHESVTKPSPSPEELALTERLLTLGRKPDPELPGRAAVEADGTVRTTADD